MSTKTAKASTVAATVATVLSLTEQAQGFLAAAQAKIDSTAGMTKDQIAKELTEALCQKLDNGEPAYKHIQYVSRTHNYYDTQSKKLENRVGKQEGTAGSSRTLRALFTQEMARYGIPADSKAVINTAVGKFAQLQRRWLASDDSVVHGLGIASVPADKLTATMAKVRAEKAAKAESQKANQTAKSETPKEAVEA